MDTLANPWLRHPNEGKHQAYHHHRSSSEPQLAAILPSPLSTLPSYLFLCFPSWPPYRLTNPFPQPPRVPHPSWTSPHLISIQPIRKPRPIPPCSRLPTIAQTHHNLTSSFHPHPSMSHAQFVRSVVWLITPLSFVATVVWPLLSATVAMLPASTSTRLPHATFTLMIFFGP